MKVIKELWRKVGWRIHPTNGTGSLQRLSWRYNAKEQRASKTASTFATFESLIPKYLEGNGGEISLYRYEEHHEFLDSELPPATQSILNFRHPWGGGGQSHKILSFTGPNTCMYPNYTKYCLSTYLWTPFGWWST